MTEIQIIKTSKKSKNIINNRHIYTFSSKNNLNLSWRCVNCDSLGRIQTDYPCELVILESVHYHEKDYSKIKTLLFKNKLFNVEFKNRRQRFFVKNRRKQF
ncbi:hypothetical protein DMUE_4865 [Dictyocoela muelleri]|nr:hypothetical protein DMUE_4865 [Dictyocoela muelleri]